MSKATLYPKANHTIQWFEDDFARGTFSVIEKILFHTTETTGFPSYTADGKEGANAPTLTYHAGTREWRQHNSLNTSARALGDPASTPVRENRDNVIQIEIVAYAKNAAKFTDANLQDLADFVAFVRKEWGAPVLTAARFVGTPDEMASVKMSSAEYDGFRGLLGHQHVPAPSSHWDPGALNVAKIIEKVKAIESGSTPAKVTTCVLTTDTKNAFRRVPITLTATVTPLGAKGSVSFQWYAGSTLGWKEIEKVALDADGKVSINNAPYNDVTYRAVFVSADTSKWTHDYAPNVTVNVLQPDEVARLLTGA